MSSIQIIGEVVYVNATSRLSAFLQGDNGEINRAAENLATQLFGRQVGEVVEADALSRDVESKKIPALAGIFLTLEGVNLFRALP